MRRQSRRLADPEQRKAFERHWEAGVPLKDLAAWFGWKDLSGPTRAAARLGLQPRRGRITPRGGRPPVLATPEQVKAFKDDWEQGITLVEMAALHGFKDWRQVSYQARRLDLPKRRGGRQTEAAFVLRGGHWRHSKHGVKVWVEEESVA